MAEWRIEALWDRPAKYMAQPSTHHLLLRVTPGAPEPAGTRQAASADPTGGRPSVAANLQAEQEAEERRAGTPALPQDAGNRVPTIAIAIDASRSMSEHDSFAACAAAAVQLAERFGPSCAVRLAVFSKAVVPIPLEQAPAALGGLKLRSVSRYDLALEWLHSELVARPSVVANTAAQAQSRSRAETPALVGILLGDGGATDGLGHDAPHAPLVERAAALTVAGCTLFAAGLDPDQGLLSALALAGATALHPAELADALTEVLGRVRPLASQEDTAHDDSARPSAGATEIADTADRASGEAELRVRIETRLPGLTLRRAVRLRPAPACLSARSGIDGWLIDAGDLAPWQTLELLVELSLPLAAFGTGEGPSPALTAAVLDGSGARLAQCQTTLDFTSDLRRSQQLGTEADQARRLWGLGALDSWTTGQGVQRARRQTGVLPPPPEQAGAPPVGGVPS